MILKAELQDLETLMAIIDEAKSFLKANNVDQWQDGYPNLESLSEDIEENHLYKVVQDNEILGLFALIDYEETYNVIDGLWRCDKPYVAIHRVAISNKFKGQNKVKEIFDYVKKSHSYIRIDTHSDNKAMQKALLKNGFELCGTIYLKDGNPRLAFDYKAD